MSTTLDFKEWLGEDHWKAIRHAVKKRHKGLCQKAKRAKGETGIGEDDGASRKFAQMAHRKKGCVFEGNAGN
jgi:hypothetical protein